MKLLSPLVLRGLLQGIVPAHRGNFVRLYEGVDILHLYGPDANDTRALAEQPSAALIRYRPGAKVPLHHHDGYEHIIVLSGSQSDESGTYEQGTCIINPPGSSHSVRSETGCLVLAIWDHPVRVVEQTPFFTAEQPS